MGRLPYVGVIGSRWRSIPASAGVGSCNGDKEKLQNPNLCSCFMRLSYRMERFSLEFGQPFRSLEDARRFFRLYDRSGGADPPLHRLTAGPSAEFPYYLPNRKDLCLLAVEIPAMEEA